ncbi:MAG: hypothetical protein HQL13_08245, partial [Candidatus Omnitrophica bacterium]|nr:hypothetical protein [Candidatus Omnitrophota bacterium]
MSKDNPLTLVERNFKLQGRFDCDDLASRKSLLEDALKSFLASNKVDPCDRADFEEMLKVLKRDVFSGNEAGAANYSSFATTEIEEALNRIPQGQALSYLLYRHRWHHRPQMAYVGDFPIHLGIESTSVCDLKCKMCFQTDP